MKKLFALALVLVMCVSILSVTAFAAETITVHAYVPADWTTPNVYSWPTGGDGDVAWPGSAMTNEGGQWYVGTISIDHQNLIINNNGAPQTSDLAFDGGYEELWVVVNSADNATVYYSEPTELPDGGNNGGAADGETGEIVPDPDGLFQVPSSLAIVGTGIPGVSDWNPGDAAADMTEVSTLVYEIEIGCPAGTNMEFKFAGNDAWDDSCNLHSGTPVIDGTCEMSNGGGMDNQMKLSVSNAAVLKFTVDLNPLANGTGAATLTITTTDGEVSNNGGTGNGTVDSNFVKPNSLAIVGTGIPGVGEWDPADATGDMTEVSDGVYEIVLTCPAGTSMTFKFAGNDAWDDTCNLGSAPVSVGTAGDLVNGSSAQDMNLSISVDAELKFTVDLNPLINGTGAATLTVVTTDGSVIPDSGNTDSGEMVTVHARIPESWGSAPCFWAWNLANQTNAFEAWPGEPMTKDGEWYTIQIPAWCDGVIVNDGGSTQTADLTIEAGKEVWIDVFSFDNCTITYSEPGERTEPTESTPTVPSQPTVPAGDSADDGEKTDSNNSQEEVKAATRNRVILIVVLVLVWVVVIAEVISIFVPKKN